MTREVCANLSCVWRCTGWQLVTACSVISCAASQCSNNSAMKITEDSVCFWCLVNVAILPNQVINRTEQVHTYMSATWHVSRAAVLCCRKMIGQDEERLDELTDRVARKTEEMRKAKASIKQLLELMQSFRRSYGVCQQQRGALKQQVRLARRLPAAAGRAQAAGEASSVLGSTDH